jgi:organic radical activating enzyme
MKPLVSQNGDLCLEITQKCYNGCPWCYKGQFVGPKMPHIPFEIVKRRFLWACKFIKFNKVFLLGGEPLTHPQLIQLIELALKNGKEVSLITSGRFSKLPHEVENYINVLDLYEKGQISVDVSFQPGRNEKYYTKMVADLRARCEKRHEALSTGKNNTDLDIFTTVVLDDSHLSFDRYMTSVAVVRDALFNDGIDEEGSVAIENCHIMLNRHFGEYQKSENWVMRISPNKPSSDFRAMARFVGEIHCSGATVKKPQGGTCPAIHAAIENDILLSSLLIRHDGELCFSLPQCISARVGLCNVDQVDAEKVIYTAVKASVETLIQNILDGKRRQVSSPNSYCTSDPEYPRGSPDAKKCNSCNFEYICNLCH